MTAWLSVLVPLLVMFFALGMERVESRLRESTVRQDELDPPRPNSCGKEPARPVARTVTGISLLRTDRRENPPQRG